MSGLLSNTATIRAIFVSYHTSILVSEENNVAFAEPRRLFKILDKAKPILVEVNAHRKCGLVGKFELSLPMPLSFD